MSRHIVRNHDLRREIFEYVLNCSDDELFIILCTLEMEDTIPKFFSCGNCKELFGDCPEGNGTEVCKSRILKYEEMRDNG